MVCKTVVAALLLLALSACVLAQQDELSLLELTRNAQGNQVKPASYGGYSVVHTCLEQTQIKNCRVTGDVCAAPRPPPKRTAAIQQDLPETEPVPVITQPPSKTVTPAPTDPDCEDGPDGGWQQTEFTCCGDKHNYGYEPKTTIGETTIDGRAASCDWSFDVLKEEPKELGYFGIVPVQESPDSPHVKIGPLKGSCQFTDEAEKCEGPYCSDMSITVQGNVYISLAFSKYPSNHLTVPSTADKCSAVATMFNNMGRAFGGRERNQQSFTFPRPDPITGEGQAYAELFAAIMASIREETTLLDLFWSTVGPYVPQRPGNDEHNYEYKHDDGLYAGLALIIMGETSVSTLKSHLKTETTGHLEFAPVFMSMANHIPASAAKWPHVTGGAMKLWFKEEDKHQPEHRY